MTELTAMELAVRAERLERFMAGQVAGRQAAEDDILNDVSADVRECDMRDDIPRSPFVNGFLSAFWMTHDSKDDIEVSAEEGQ